MKIKQIILSLLFISISVISVAQPHGKRGKELRKEELKAQKIAFITSNLELTVQEAEKFWPVYNEFDAKAEELRMKRKRTMDKLMDEEQELADKEYEKIADELISIETSESKLITGYHERFKKVIPVKKVVKLYVTEHAFKNHLLKEIKRCGNPNKQ